VGHQALGTVARSAAPAAGPARRAALVHAGSDGEDIEVDGRGPHLVHGESVVARSRTYIAARLTDNPDLARTGYAAVLAGLPQELRRAYRDGDFSAALRDDEWQVIPTAWIEAAQARWTPTPPRQSMTAIGVDVAQGGNPAIGADNAGRPASGMAAPAARNRAAKNRTELR
jgi:hypothetical protein